jgi:hypothetical protein
VAELEDHSGLNVLEIESGRDTGHGGPRQDPTTPDGGMTLGKIGVLLGKGPERIRQIEARGIQKLRMMRAFGRPTDAELAAGFTVEDVWGP